MLKNFLKFNDLKRQPWANVYHVTGDANTMHACGKFGSLNGSNAGPFLRIFLWKGQLRKGTSGRKGKAEKYFLLGGLGGGGASSMLTERP